MREKLLVHILELAGESDIIRKRGKLWLKRAKKARAKLHENKAAKFEKIFNTITNHRVTVVCDASRSAQLAYAFLKGRSYGEVEVAAKSEPDWLKIKNFVMKFYDTDKWSDPSDVEKRIMEWITFGAMWFRIHKIGPHSIEWADKKLARELPIVYNVIKQHRPELLYHAPSTQKSAPNWPS